MASYKERMSHIKVILESKKMGQKVNPIGFRTGRMTGWKSRWFSDSGVYKDLLLEDFAVRKELMKKLASAGIVGVEIERQQKAL